ncbi:Hypothetical protein PBC10988_10550 [Planctomycetales bacterium 10988]|nr:Hypothetical protein PBC10988_10550 [Planctomycetales bacterium 10988]
MRNLIFLLVVFGGLLGYVGYFISASPAEARPDIAPWETKEIAFQAASLRVERLLEEKWQAEQIEPAPKADDLAIARRLGLALLGSIPSLEELRQFEQDSRAKEDPVQWWVSKWIDSEEDRRFSEYFGERWARAFVGNHNGVLLLYRRRRFVSWLSDQLHENRPFDLVVREMIASDGLWTDKPQTNFITAAINRGTSVKNNPDPELLAGTVGRAFLGIRLDCAQCHDHPFEAWTQRDFYELAAFFGQTKTSLVGIQDRKQAKFKVEDPPGSGTKVVIEPDVPFLGELLTKDKSWANPRRRLADWVTHPENEYFAQAIVNRTWALMVGRPLVEPVDDLTSVGEVSDLLQVLAEEFVKSGFDMKDLIRLIAATPAFQRESFDMGPEAEKAWASFPLTRLRPEQVIGGVLQASSLQTIDYEASFLFRLARDFGISDFVKRYGDQGEEELREQGGTIPQRLLMMNGKLLSEKIKEDGSPFESPQQLATLAPNDAQMVEIAYLITLTRRPTWQEQKYFLEALKEKKGRARKRALEDLLWSLMNSTEFSWNH